MIAFLSTPATSPLIKLSALRCERVLPRKPPTRSGVQCSLETKETTISASKSLKSVPARRQVPVLGSVIDLLANPDPSEWVGEYGPIYSMQELGRPVIRVADLDAIKAISKDAETFRGRDSWPSLIVHTLGPDELFNIDGAEHAYKRRLIQPAFGPACLERNHAIIRHSSHILWDSVAQATEKGKVPFKLSDLIFEHSLRSTIQITSSETQTLSDVQRLAKLFNQMLDGMFVLPFMPKAKTALRSSAQLRKAFSELLRNRLRESAETIEFLRATDEGEWVGASKRGLKSGEVDLLSVICAASEVSIGKHVMHDDGELESLSSLLQFTWFAGMITTPSVILVALLKLGLDDSLRKRLLDEQANIIARHDGNPEITANQARYEMPLLASLVEEVLRLYPPVLTSYRVTNRDCAILGHKIPRETVVSLDMYTANRDEKYYKNALTFIPDRFARPVGEEGEKITPICSFLEGGHHSCVGALLARMNARTTIATLLRFYDFTLDPNQSNEILRTGPVKPKSGVDILSCKRKAAK